MAAAQLQQLTQELKQINGQIERALSPSLAPSSPSPAPATSSMPQTFEAAQEYNIYKNAAAAYNLSDYNFDDDDDDKGTTDLGEVRPFQPGGKKRSRRRKTLRRRRKTLRRKKNKGRVHVRS